LEIMMNVSRVIIADRHQTMLEGLRDLLTTVFDAVVMVADDKSLLDAVERLSADLVIVDISLPAAGSMRVVRRIKTRSPGTKCIVLSIHDEPVVVRTVRNAGADGLVLKRSAATELLPAVEAVMHGDTYISPAFTQRTGSKG
jgi:DNA-binding NarL/FixJ family response regulator